MKTAAAKAKLAENAAKLARLLREIGFTPPVGGVFDGDHLEAQDEASACFFYPYQHPATPHLSLAVLGRHGYSEPISSSLLLAAATLPTAPTPSVVKVRFRFH